MRNWLLRWVASGLALYIITKLHIGIHVDKDSLGTLIVAVIVLGLINSFLRPIILFFVWPINCLTFGLFSFVVNAMLFWLVGSNLVPGFHVDGFVPALIGSILMGLISGFLNFILADRNDRER
jgi:putative membrane protein